jgi:hypothetical protein
MKAECYIHKWNGFICTPAHFLRYIVEVSNKCVALKFLNLLRLEIIYSSKAFLKHLVCIQHSQMYLVVRKESGYNIYVFSYLNHTSYHGSSKTKTWRFSKWKFCVLDEVSSTLICSIEKETGQLLSSFLDPELASRQFSRVPYTNYREETGEQCLCKISMQQCNGQWPVKYKILATKVGIATFTPWLGRSRHWEANQMNEAVTLPWLGWSRRPEPNQKNEAVTHRNAAPWCSRH